MIMLAHMCAPLLLYSFTAPIQSAIPHNLFSANFPNIPLCGILVIACMCHDEKLHECAFALLGRYPPPRQYPGCRYALP